MAPKFVPPPVGAVAVELLGAAGVDEAVSLAELVIVEEVVEVKVVDDDVVEDVVVVELDVVLDVVEDADVDVIEDVEAVELDEIKVVELDRLVIVVPNVVGTLRDVGVMVKLNVSVGRLRVMPLADAMTVVARLLAVPHPNW